MLLGDHPKFNMMKDLIEQIYTCGGTMGIDFYISKAKEFDLGEPFKPEDYEIKSRFQGPVNWAVVPNGTEVTFINQGVDLTLEETTEILTGGSIHIHEILERMINRGSEYDFKKLEQGLYTTIEACSKLITHKRTLEAQQKEKDQ